MPYRSVNGTSLYYEDEGRGPALVFVHGWGTSARVWGAQQADLIGDYRVVVLDWRGCGRSERPAAGNSIEGVVADLAALIDALDLDRPVVVGSSIGGVFVTELGLHHPELVGGVVPVSNPAYWPAQGMDLDGLGERMGPDRAGFFADWVPHWFRPGTSPALIDWTIRQILDSGTYIDAHFAAIAAYDPRADLTRLKVPIHYLHGELDTEIPLQVARHCAACTPGARVTPLSESAHMPHQEQPARFNAALRDALAHILASQPAA